MKRSTRPAFILACLIFFVAGTGACTQTQPAAPAEVAKAFVASINSKDVETLVGLSATPLWVRMQEWTNVREKNGIAFVLGKANDINLTDRTQIKKYFSDTVGKIAVENEVPVEASLMSQDDLQDELRGSKKVWEGLSTHVFSRGMGDVWHIFVVGVDDKRKVAAVYMN